MLGSSHAGFALLVSRTYTSHENHCRVLTWSWISVGKHVGGDAIPSREHLPEILQSPLPVCMHNKSPDPVYPGIHVTSDEFSRLDKHISVTEDIVGSETQPLVPICDTYAIFEAIVLSSAKRKFPCQGSLRSLSPVDGGERPEQICGGCGWQSCRAAAHHEHDRVRLCPTPCLGCYGTEASHCIHQNSSLHSHVSLCDTVMYSYQHVMAYILTVCSDCVKMGLYAIERGQVHEHSPAPLSLC